MDIREINKRIGGKINDWEPRFRLTGTELVIFDMLIQYAFAGYDSPIRIDMGASMSNIENSRKIYSGVYLADPLLLGWNERNSDDCDYSFYSSGIIEKDVIRDSRKTFCDADDDFVYGVLRKQADLMLKWHFPEIQPVPPTQMMESITFELNSGSYIYDMRKTFRMYDDIECKAGVEAGWIYFENLYMDNWAKPFIAIMKKIKMIANRIDNNGDLPKEFLLERLAATMDVEFPNIGKIIDKQSI